MTAVCKGNNCNCTDGLNHSPECVAEHTATVDAAALTDLIVRVTCLRAKVDAAVHENFGYVPFGAWHDRLVNDLHEAELELRVADMKSYEAYAEKFY